MKYYKRLISLKETDLVDFPEDIKLYINNINFLLNNCGIVKLHLEFEPIRYQVYDKNDNEVLFEIILNDFLEIRIIWTIIKFKVKIENHNKLLPYIIYKHFNIDIKNTIFSEYYITRYVDKIGIAYNIK